MNRPILVTYAATAATISLLLHLVTFIGGS